MNTDMMPLLTGAVLDDDLLLSLREVCHLCRVTAEHLLDLVDEGVVEPQGSSPREWRFSGSGVRRVQVALRLERDLRINPAGAAMVLDLLEELEELRRRQRWRPAG
jgi:chaperone modulatory protein CbpM